MPNVVKYNTSSESNAIRVGYFWFGTGDYPKGTTTMTGYWNGITPPNGGWTIYCNKASQGPAIFCPANQSELALYTNRIANSSTYSSVADCIAYYKNRSDVAIFNKNYPNIVTKDLQFLLDPSFVSSYPTNGIWWYDLSPNVKTATLTNGPTFSAWVGSWGKDNSLGFDGTNDFAYIPAYNYNITNTFTIEITCYINNNQNALFNFGVSGYGVRGISCHWPWNSNGDLYFDVTDTTNNSGGYFRWIKYGPNNMTGYTAMYHFIVDSSGNMNVYQNLAKLVPDTVATIPSGRTINLSSDGVIGAFNTSGLYSLSGNIQNFKIYNRELDRYEKAQNYLMGDLPFLPSSVIDYGNPLSKNSSIAISTLSLSVPMVMYFEGTGSVTRSSEYNGTLRLTNGRIYNNVGTLSWYGNYSFTFWVKMVTPMSGNFYTESSRTMSGCARVYASMNSYNGFTYTVWDNSTSPYQFSLSSATAVQDGNWHHIACIWSNGSQGVTKGLYLYVNGVQEGYISFNGNDGSYGTLHLGGVYGCAGTVDSDCYLGVVSYYENRALNSDEVFKNYMAHAYRYK